MCGLRRGGAVALKPTKESTALVVRDFPAAAHGVIVPRCLNVAI